MSDFMVSCYCYIAFLRTCFTDGFLGGLNILILVYIPLLSANIFFVGNIRHMEIRNAETLIRKPGMNLCLKIIPRNRQMINVAECEQQCVSCVSFDIVL